MVEESERTCGLRTTTGRRGLLVAGCAGARTTIDVVVDARCDQSTVRRSSGLTGGAGGGGVPVEVEAGRTVDSTDILCCSRAGVTCGWFVISIPKESFIAGTVLRASCSRNIGISACDSGA